MSRRFNMWVPSPPRSVIGPTAYYPFSDGGVMKAPLPSLIVAGLYGVFGILKFFLGFFIFLKGKYTVIVIITGEQALP